MDSKYLKYKIKYYQLKQKINKQINKQNGGASEGDNYFNQKEVNENKPSIYLFKASWCGHCINFRETWNALADKFHDKINFISYDSKNDSKKMKEWRVEGFPTLIFRKGTSATEYNGDRDIDSLINFIKNQI
jgi:protein disulfide-isomerase